MPGDQIFQSQVIHMLSELTINVGAVSERVARLEAGNTERCANRGKEIEDLQSKDKEFEKRICRLEHAKTFSIGKKVGAAGVIAACTAAAIEVYSKWGPKLW